MSNSALTLEIASTEHLDARDGQGAGSVGEPVVDVQMVLNCPAFDILDTLAVELFGCPASAFRAS